VLEVFNYQALEPIQAGERYPTRPGGGILSHLRIA
jgi:hypothetical protein